MATIPNTQGAAILLVEDHPEVGRPLAAALDAQGHHVHQVADAQAGMDFLRQGIALDLLLIDLHVRGGDAGRHLIKTACLVYPALSIIITRTKVAPQPVPGLTVLKKPFRIHTLLAAVGAAVAERR